MSSYHYIRAYPRVLKKNRMVTPCGVQYGYKRIEGETEMTDSKVGPTGLTAAESEEIHRHLVQGTQIFGMLSAVAHLLAYLYSPWLH